MCMTVCWYVVFRVFRWLLLLWCVWYLSIQRYLSDILGRRKYCLVSEAVCQRLFGILGFPLLQCVCLWGLSVCFTVKGSSFLWVICIGQCKTRSILSRDVANIRTVPKRHFGNIFQWACVIPHIIPFSLCCILLVFFTYVKWIHMGRDGREGGVESVSMHQTYVWMLFSKTKLCVSQEDHRMHFIWKSR